MPLLVVGQQAREVAPGLVPVLRAVVGFADVAQHGPQGRGGCFAFGRRQLRVVRGLLHGAQFLKENRQGFVVVTDLLVEVANVAQGHAAFHHLPGGRVHLGRLAVIGQRP